MVMETKKSHNLLFASWQTRKASRVIQSESEHLRTRGDGVILSQVGSPENWGAGGLLVSVLESEGPATRSTNVQGWRRWMSQLRKREQIALPPAFCSLWAFDRVDEADPH